MKTEETPCAEIVLPGQVLKEENLFPKKKKIILGPGLRRVALDVVVVKCGVLRKKTPNMVWVDSLQKRYIPTQNETVVGVVTKKTGDYFRVDIGAADHALLHYLSFEGATKKYKPDIQVGDSVFGKLVVPCSDMEPELVCSNVVTGRKERYGKLSNDGFLFSCSLHLVRKVLSPHCPLLNALGKGFSYESAIGMNGKIWVKGEDVQTTIAVANAILTAETMSNNEIRDFCSKISSV